MALSEIAINGVYSFSNTLGKTVFPIYELPFAQNPGGLVDTKTGNILSAFTPGLERNPYIVAETVRGKGFSYIEGIRLIARDPVRYAAVVLFSLPAMLAPEGVYPVIIEKVPTALRIVLWLSLKICLSLLLWLGAAALSIRRARNPLILVYSAPIIVFLLIYGNLNIEQRWFFPILPVIWTLALCHLLIVARRIRITTPNI